MIFEAPLRVPPLPFAPPDTIPVGDFVLNGDPSISEDVRRRPVLTDALSGVSYTRAELKQKVEALARSLCREFGWSPNQGSPNEKVVGIFSLNTLDYSVLIWAIHRIGGICLMLHATNSVTELENHMQVTGCKVLFTCAPLMPTSLKVFEQIQAHSSRLYLVDLPKQLTGDLQQLSHVKTLSQLIKDGIDLEPIESLHWAERESRKRVAFLCSTSGTSGTQKLVQMTHYNYISNVVQAATFDNMTKKGLPQNSLGIMPFGHGYGLFLLHVMVWVGDTMIVHAKFDMQETLKSIATFRIERLYLIPAIVAALIENSFLLDVFDTSSVKSIILGGAACGRDLAEKMRALRPTWTLQLGYGCTEMGCVGTLQISDDWMPGSSGCILPGVQIQLLGEDGQPIKDHDCAGEIWAKSPSMTPGYFGSEDAHDRRLITSDGWLRTGDIGLFRQSSQGTEHLFIVDRLRDMIKVKACNPIQPRRVLSNQAAQQGIQVAPAEIEEYLRAHPAVADVAVIGIPDDTVGERPKAFIVRSKKEKTELSEQALSLEINDWVKGHFNDLHWLHKNIDFIGQIPKNQGGKVLKVKLREMSGANGTMQHG